MKNVTKKSSLLNTDIILLAPISIYQGLLEQWINNIFSILTNFCPRTENIDLRNIHDSKAVAS